jgi:hypothetical protein
MIENSKSKDQFNLELDIQEKLNEVKKYVGDKCIDKLPESNCARIMAVCGAKGSNNNLN